MQNGVVNSFNANKGFGCILAEYGGQDVFVHISAIERAGISTLVEGQKVGFELLGRSGRFSAHQLMLRS